MNIDTSCYELDGLKIAWGKPFREVLPLLEHIDKFEPYGGWPNIRCKCSRIFGLPATELGISAPFDDRPVLQATYELAPIQSGLFEKLHVPYFKQLVNVLGDPYKIESRYNQPHLKKEYLAGAVVFSAVWMFNDVSISLSVYGGVRSNESGLSAAGIFIDWMDEIRAAKPFREKAELVEKAMSAGRSDDLIIKKFKLQNKQRAFMIIHYELKDPYIAAKDTVLRASQLALYRRDLYQTPNFISSSLDDNEIAYYRLKGIDKIFISNKWDTIYLVPMDVNEMIYWNILPARGPGGQELELRGLNIVDSKNSPGLIELVEQIEIDLGQLVVRKETYDD